MAAKFLTILSLVVAASAIPVVPVAKVYHAEPEAPAHYEYQYSVHDTHTGDVKSAKEDRKGDATHGSYSVLQPDGLTRIVDYTVDAHNGFNAVVRYEGHATEATKLAYAPVAKVAYAPVAYAAPVAKIAYAAPVAKVAVAPVAKVAYTQNLGHVTFASPAISYHH